MLEKHLERVKTVHDIAPMFLRSPARIEALVTVYFLVLLVQALIQREVGRAIHRERLAAIAFYPKGRACTPTTTEQILSLFSHAERHTRIRNGNLVQLFDPELTLLQRQILALLGVAEHAFRSRHTLRKWP